MIKRMIYRASDFPFVVPLNDLNDDIHDDIIKEDKIISIVSHAENSGSEVLIVYYKE